MKKILFVTESLNTGGLERVLVDIANVLVQRKYDVTILLYMQNSKNNLQKQLNPKVKVIQKERKPFKILRKTPYIHRYYRNYKWEKRTSARSLYKYYVGKEKFDVEIAFYRGPSIKIISGSTNKKSLKLAWVHTDFRLCDPKSITHFFNNLDEVRYAYKQFDKIVCVSNKARESFIEVIGCEEKTTTIYNMIPVETIIQKSKEPCTQRKQRFTIITVGRLIDAKGYDRLLRVIKRLNEEGFLFDMWFVGYGRNEDELKAYAQNNHLENISFLGYQENPYSYMAQADLFICSSIREGFSLVVAEAMACGLPVISTRCTGPTEILNNGEFGILVDNDETSIYEGLKAILTNSIEYRCLSEVSKRRSRDFDVDKIINNIITMIEGD